MTIQRDPSLGVWLYSPSLTLAILATALYTIPLLTNLLLAIFFPRNRSWPSLWIIVGNLLEVAGYAARIASTRDYNSVGAYAIQSTFIILAPLFIAASNYLLLSRLILHTLPSSKRTLFHINAFWLADIFIVCDVITFIVQASGAAIVASGINDLASGSVSEAGSVTAGNDILIAGLAIQVCTFGIFLLLAVMFHTRAIRVEKGDRGEGWVWLLGAVYVSSGCILIRTIYRLVEFGLGIEGYPFNHEWIFYVFESFPMFPAIAIFCVIRPGKYLQQNPRLSANNIQLESQSTDR